MPRLSHLLVRHFRLLDEVEFSPSPGVSILLGANNAGKSNIIDALVFLKDVATQPLPNAFERRHGFERIVSRHDWELFPVIELTLENGTSLAATVTNGRIDTAASPADGTGSAVYQAGSVMVLSEPQFAPMNEFFRNLVHVDPFRNVVVQMPVEALTMIAETGTDLTKVLHYHYTSNRERFDEFEEAVKSVLPEVDIIETPIIGGSQTTVQVRFQGDSLRYDLWQVSSGVKDVLVLLTALHFSARQALILIEEPENHLHPTAQRALAGVIQRIAEEEEKQVILTTHSEVILRQFDDDVVWFVDKKEGKASITRLVDSELHDVWERLGFEAESFLEILGNARQVLVIVEGRDDLKALEPLWRDYEIAEMVLVRQSRGGGPEEIAENAGALRRAFERFELPVKVFVLLDSDGKRDDKLELLQRAGFDDATSHVWTEKEIESYLAIPGALEAISGRPRTDVEAAISQATARGKEGLRQILDELGMTGTPPNVIVQNALSNDRAALPAELAEVPRKVRSLLGLPADPA